MRVLSQTVLTLTHPCPSHITVSNTSTRAPLLHVSTSTTEPAGATSPKSISAGSSRLVPVLTPHSTKGAEKYSVMPLPRFVDVTLPSSPGTASRRYAPTPPGSPVHRLGVVLGVGVPVEVGEAVCVLDPDRVVEGLRVPDRVDEGLPVTVAVAEALGVVDDVRELVVVPCAVLDVEGEEDPVGESVAPSESDDEGLPVILGVSDDVDDHDGEFEDEDESDGDEDNDG